MYLDQLGNFFQHFASLFEAVDPLERSIPEDEESQALTLAEMKQKLQLLEPLKASSLDFSVPIHNQELPDAFLWPKMTVCFSHARMELLAAQEASGASDLATSEVRDRIQVK